MLFRIECAIEEKYDVLVCGGGPAGFSAALYAARNGAKVALVEQMGYLGGAATVNGVNVFPFGYHDGERYVMGGIMCFVEPSVFFVHHSAVCVHQSAVVA